MRAFSIGLVLAAFAATVMWGLFALYIMSLNCDVQSYTKTKEKPPQLCSSFLSWRTESDDLSILLIGSGGLVVVLWVAAILLARKWLR